ncbi:MAG TPA: hypothetical protein VIP11_12625 [Gemmatimonadaceae bacterium]
MTSEQLAAQLRSEIDAYEYPQVEGTVGTLWTTERVAEEIALLRDSLLRPSRRTLHIHEQPDAVVWLVAAERGVAVYFDERRGEFGLGRLEADGSIQDWAVYGDLVGTFMAR